MADLVLVRSMDRRQRDRINPLVLLGIAVALLVAAFFCYSGHPVTDSNLYSPHAPGWIAVVLFVVIGVAGRIIYVCDQRRNAKNAKRHSTPKT